jgi:hypothetical protein
MVKEFFENTENDQEMALHSHTLAIMDYVASKMLHHNYDTFVHNLKKLFDSFLTSFHGKTK